jgi:hypothetical protein
VHWWDKLQWGDVPTGLVALATVGTLWAAILAARWTSRTVSAARDQVKAANDQLNVVKEQLALARADSAHSRQVSKEQLALAHAESERDREAARASETRFLQSQLDLRAPVVYARAIPGSNLPQYQRHQADGSGSWSRAPLASATITDAQADPQWFDRRQAAVMDGLSVADDEGALLFMVTFTIEFVNCSDLPAQVDILELPSAELDLRQGQPLVVPPRETRSVVWTRRFGSQMLKTQEGIDREDVSFGWVKFWVRDLGQSVRDAYAFNLDLRYFKRDGSRLIVSPEPPFPWSESYAGQTEPRVYERLEASEKS